MDLERNNKSLVRPPTPCPQKQMKPAFGHSKERSCLLENLSLLKGFKGKVGTLESSCLHVDRTVARKPDNVFSRVRLSLKSLGEFVNTFRINLRFLRIQCSHIWNSESGSRGHGAPVPITAAGTGGPTFPAAPLWDFQAASQGRGQHYGGFHTEGFQSGGSTYRAGSSGELS